eukprot:113835-Rhodomonas_salina.1
MVCEPEATRTARTRSVAERDENFKTETSAIQESAFSEHMRNHAGVAMRRDSAGSREKLEQDILECDAPSNDACAGASDTVSYLSRYLREDGERH